MDRPTDTPVVAAASPAPDAEDEDARLQRLLGLAAARRAELEAAEREVATLAKRREERALADMRSRVERLRDNEETLHKQQAETRARVQAIRDAQAMAMQRADVLKRELRAHEERRSAVSGTRALGNERADLRGAQPALASALGQMAVLGCGAQSGGGAPGVARVQPACASEATGACVGHQTGLKLGHVLAADRMAPAHVSLTRASEPAMAPSAVVASAEDAAVAARRRAAAAP